MAAVDELKNDIDTAQFRRLYYIYGSENYLKRFWLSRLRTAMLGDDCLAPDLHKIDGKEGDVSEFADLLEAIPVFSEKKLIIVTDAAANGEICSYLRKNKDSLGDDTVLVFYAATEPFDERLKDFKDLKALIDTVGLAVKIDAPAPQMLEKWVSQQFRKKDTKISANDVSYLLSQANNSMDSLNNEIDKLCAYCDGEVTRKAIDTVVIKTADAKTYELVDAVLDKNSNKASECLSTLLLMRTEEIVIMASLYSAVCNLYKIKIYLKSELSYADIAKKTGMRDFVVKKYAARLKNIPFSVLSKLIDMCCEADIASKSTAVDEAVILTSLITEMTEVL